MPEVSSYMYVPSALCANSVQSDAGHKKKSEDLAADPTVTLAPVPPGTGKSHSAMLRVSSAAPYSSAPMLPQHPSVSAGPGYPTLPFPHPLPAEHPSVPSLKPLPESHASGPINNPPFPSDQISSIIAATTGISPAIQYISDTENAGEHCEYNATTKEEGCGTGGHERRLAKK